MEQAKYTITWETFLPNIGNTINELFIHQIFTDVTLVSDDEKQIQAHKFVLSACSPTLKSLLLNNPHPHPMLYLRGVKEDDLKSLLQFMYQGEVSIFQDRVDKFFHSAKDLRIEQLCHGLSKAQDIKDDIVLDKSSILEDYEFKLDLPFDEFSDNKEATTDKENKCKECGACFSVKSTLVRHTKIKHKGIRFFCSL
jgi:hypothetical protein